MMKSAELAELGSRFRSPALRAQALRTLDLVERDPEASSIVPASWVRDLRAAANALAAAGADEESDAARGDRFQRAKGWRRALVHRAKAARASGAAVPEEMASLTSRGGDPKALGADVRRLVALARRHPSVLAPVRVDDALLAEGESLAKDLEADARPPKRSKKVQDACVAKGRAYLLVKAVNLLAQSVHAEVGECEEYTLDTLYRSVRRS